jgi:hypothetical protein
MAAVRKARGAQCCLFHEPPYPGADRQPNGRIVGHPSARGDRLAQNVLDRGAAAGHATPTGSS